MEKEKEVIQAKGLRRSFTMDRKKIDVLRGLDLTVRSGELLGIVGASGVGKSTLLHILGGLEQPSGGEVSIDGDDIYRLKDTSRSGVRGRKIGFVFQFHHLLPEFTALENVLIPAMIAGMEKSEALGRAEELFASIGLADRMDHRPGKLSGGEQQRTAMVRALINNPSVLLADEPTGNLDEKTAEDVFGMLRKLVKERNLASVIVTHNLRLAREMDRVYELHEGILRTKE